MPCSLEVVFNTVGRQAPERQCCAAPQRQCCAPQYKCYPLIERLGRVMPGVEQEARMGTHAWLLDEKHRWSDVYNWKQCGWCCSGKSRAKFFWTHLHWRCKHSPHASGDPRFFGRREIGRCAALSSLWDAPSVNPTSGHSVLVAKTNTSMGM